MSRQHREAERGRKLERRLEPDWALVGVAIGALAVSVDCLWRPLWIGWRWGWDSPFRRAIPGGPSGRQIRGFTVTTPHEALSGLSGALAVAAFVIGVVLLWRAFASRRGPTSP